MISAPQMPRSRVPAGGPLTNGQKARICILAREAWEAECRPGDFGDWRHEQQARACGHGSLLACAQADYLLLTAHFKNLLGRSGAAFRDLMRHGTEGKRLAVHKLRAACDQYGFAYPDYPAAICRRQYRCSIEDASERQAWNLFITVRSRGQARGRRAAA